MTSLNAYEDEQDRRAKVHVLVLGAAIALVVAAAVAIVVWLL